MYPTSLLQCDPSYHSAVWLNAVHCISVNHFSVHYFAMHYFAMQAGVACKIYVDSTEVPFTKKLCAGGVGWGGKVF